MIKKLTIMAACLVLAGCGTNCLKQTSAANVTLGEIMYQGNLAYDANYINKETFGQVIDGVEQAKTTLDTARLMCVAEDKSFETQFKLVEQGITKSLTLLDEGKTK